MSVSRDFEDPDGYVFELVEMRTVSQEVG